MSTALTILGPDGKFVPVVRDKVGRIIHGVAIRPGFVTRAKHGGISQDAEMAKQAILGAGIGMVVLTSEKEWMKDHPDSVQYFTEGVFADEKGTATVTPPLEGNLPRQFYVVADDDQGNILYPPQVFTESNESGVVEGRLMPKTTSPLQYSFVSNDYLENGMKGTKELPPEYFIGGNVQLLLEEDDVQYAFPRSFTVGKDDQLLRSLILKEKQYVFMFTKAEADGGAGGVMMAGYVTFGDDPVARVTDADLRVIHYEEARPK